MTYKKRAVGLYTVHKSSPPYAWPMSYCCLFTDEGIPKPLMLLVEMVLHVLNSYEDIWHIEQHTFKIPYRNPSENKDSFLFKQMGFFKDISLLKILRKQTKLSILSFS